MSAKYAFLCIAGLQFRYNNRLTDNLSFETASMLKRSLPVWIFALLFCAVGWPVLWLALQLDPTASSDMFCGRHTLWLAVLAGTLTIATVGLMVANILQRRLARTKFIATHRPTMRVRIKVRSASQRAQQE